MTVERRCRPGGHRREGGTRRPAARPRLRAGRPGQRPGVRLVHRGHGDQRAPRTRSHRGRRPWPVRGDDAAGAAFGHVLVELEPMAEAVVVLDYSGQRHLRRQRRADRRRRGVADGGVSCRTGPTTPSTCRTITPSWAGTPRLTHTAVTLGGSVVRLAPSVRYAGPGGEAELRGLYFADAGQHLEHRLFVDHTRAQLPQPGQLQGRPAGRRRARGVDRRRGHPGRGDRHGHLRVQPQPRPHRRHPGRLGAEPGDPHRRGGRRGPRQRERAAGGPSPVLPDGPGDPVRGGPAAGDPRLLRRADRADRGAGAARAHHPAVEAELA